MWLRIVNTDSGQSCKIILRCFSATGYSRVRRRKACRACRKQKSLRKHKDVAPIRAHTHLSSRGLAFGAHHFWGRFNARLLILFVPEVRKCQVRCFSEPVQASQWPMFSQSMPGAERQVLAKLHLFSAVKRLARNSYRRYLLNRTLPKMGDIFNGLL